jgi:predicted methyltransferase
VCTPFFQVDSESLRESNVREVLSQACTNFVGNLEDQQDMASLVDEQMMLLRKCFKVPSELGDAGWIRVSKQLIQLYRTGKLGRYTLDLVPSDGHQKKLSICIVGSAPS